MQQPHLPTVNDAIAAQVAMYNQHLYQPDVNAVFGRRKSSAKSSTVDYEQEYDYEKV